MEDIENMKKNISILLVAVVLGLSGSAGAVTQRSFPQDKRGAPVAHPLYGGYAYSYRNTASEAVVCTGKCLLAGLIMSTGATTTFLRIRDTGTADGAGSSLVPAIYYRVQPDTGNVANPIVLPVLANNGISIQANTMSNGETVTVLYLDLD